MRKRSVLIRFFLNEDEAIRFDGIVCRSGMTRSAYLRTLINGLVPADEPPQDYCQMMRELHAIGNNLNQIASRAHATGVIDESRYTGQVKLLAQSIATITKAVKEPRRQ